MAYMRSNAIVRIVKILALVGVLAAMARGVGAATRFFASDHREAMLTTPVTSGSIEETVLANGTLEPARMVNVGAQVSGQIKALHVRLGQAVKQGDLIAEIDSVTQNNALRIAEAALANVTAQRKARLIQLGQAEAAYRRQAYLMEHKATSRSAFETAEAANQTLAAEVASLDAQIGQAGVEVENARVNLAYTRIVAPMDGVVIAIVTKEGQTLNSTQSAPTVVVLAQLDVMTVKVQISEADVGRVLPGQKAWFTVLGNERAHHEAKLRQIEPAPASMSTEAGVQASAAAQGTTAIYYNGLFEVPNRDGQLRPLMTAQVHIVLGNAKDALLVSWSALSGRDVDGRYHVRVKTARGEIEDRLVTIGFTDKVQAQVIDGLSLGEEVVITADGPLSDPAAGLL